MIYGKLKHVMVPKHCLMNLSYVKATYQYGTVVDELLQSPNSSKELFNHINLVLFLGIVWYFPHTAQLLLLKSMGLPYITHGPSVPALSGHPGHTGTWELALNAMFRQLNQVFETLLL